MSKSNILWIASAVAVAVAIVIAFLAVPKFLDNTAQEKSQQRNRLAEAPPPRVVEVVREAPPAPPAVAPGMAKVHVDCGPDVTVDASATGSNPDVNVSVKGCQPKVVTPPCCQPKAAPPVYRAPPVVRYHPAPKRAPVAASCFVRVDLTQHDRVTPYYKAMPLEVTDKESNRVLSRITLQPGRNLVAVPCDGRREICLTLNGKRTEVLARDWFARHRGNSGQGGVFNPNAPVWFAARS